MSNSCGCSGGDVTAVVVVLMMLGHGRLFFDATSQMAAHDVTQRGPSNHT